MAPKKIFTHGIDSLLTPTITKDVTPDQSDPIDMPEKQLDNDPLIGVLFRVPTSLKIKMEHFCTDNRLKQQELIIRAVKQFINQ